ncbi:MAG TPA: pyridoxamine 5'-phosphate oxidase family protein [Acidocella sp.]|nr:pyridoxamine 5'-phosphate oxidase family protein [Acidocella sp.]
MAANQEQMVRDAAALMLGARSATLATAANAIPHAALVTPALDTDAQPLLLLSELSTHTAQLRANPSCALLFTGQPTGANPQTAPRLCLTGEARPLDAQDKREIFLRLHPYAKLYIDFADFKLWKLFVLESNYVGGFASASSLKYSALQHEIFKQTTQAEG